MRYREFIAERDGLEKRLGILGETHVYTPEESTLASKVVPTYNVLAHETSQKITGMVLIGVLYLPMLLAYMRATGRSFDNPTALDIAKNSGKRIVSLEPDEDSLYPIPQKLAFAVVGLVSIPLSLAFFLNPELARRYETSEGTNSKNDKKQSWTNRKLKGLMSYAYRSNRSDRDNSMAEIAVKLLEEPGAEVLISCGENHVDGIVGALYSRLELTEIEETATLVPS